MNFEFGTANRIIFGAGALKQAGPVARAFGSCAAVITGRDASRAEGLRGILSGAGVESRVFPVKGEPTTEEIVQIVDSAGAFDVVVGFGGGSAMDAAKAVAALKANGGDLLDYLEVIGRNQPLARASVPCVAIPTTAGTGAEVTRNAVLASPEHKVKVSLRGPHVMPRVAIVDPELTMSLPREATAFTGMDALTQLIEPLTCNRANPMTDALCREGLARAARSLRAAWEDGSDGGAREEMCVASLFGGLALANAGLGAAHGFAGPIGGMFEAPHGAVCAALLPQVMRANVAALRKRGGNAGSVGRYGEVARNLTGRAAEPEEGADWAQALTAHFGIPGLRRYGITPSNFPAIIEKAQRSSSMKANPVELSAEELEEILRGAL